LAFGIGRAAAASLTLIPEEFGGRDVRIEEVADTCVGSVIKRLSEDMSYGVIVLAEGLSEAIGVESLYKELKPRGTLTQHGRSAYDKHGIVGLGEIGLGRLVRNLVQARLNDLGLPIKVIAKELGYELRSADPIALDIQYARDLGYGAVMYLSSVTSGCSGVI